MELLRLLRDKEAHQLAEMLISTHHHSQTKEIDIDTDPELMIYAFLKVAEL